MYLPIIAVYIVAIVSLVGSAVCAWVIFRKDNHNGN
jgi:hypothetical protein